MEDTTWTGPVKGPVRPCQPEIERSVPSLAEQRQLTLPHASTFPAPLRGHVVKLADSRHISSRQPAPDAW